MDIDISNPPDFDIAPVDAYGDVMPDEDDFDVPLFDVGIVVEKNHPIPKPRSEPKKLAPKVERVNELEELRPYVEIPEQLMDTVIGRLASRVSECLEFPEASVFMTLLASASASVSTSYAVQYKTGTPVALGVYLIVEHPPATKKSYILDIGIKEYSIAISEHNKKVYSKLREAEEGDPNLYSGLAPGFNIATDATSAALDKHLSACSEGRFVVASAEQSALISLFPESGSFSSTNELILKGWAGEHVAGMRGGRNAFSGTVQGSVILIAQNGSSKRVLVASNGSGMAERFVFMAEPDMLGERLHRGQYPSNEDKREFVSACNKCVQIYSSNILSYKNSNIDTRVIYEPSNLIQLRASNIGYQAILQAVRDMEPRMGELKESGDMIMLSWLGKLETHVLKFAANMHVIECHAAGCEVPTIIPDKWIYASIDLVEVLSDHVQQLLRDSGESGSSAEEDVIIDLLTGKQLEKRALILAARNRKPFRSMNSSQKAATARVEAMLKAGSLVIVTGGKVAIV